MRRLTTGILIEANLLASKLQEAPLWRVAPKVLADVKIALSFDLTKKHILDLIKLPMPFILLPEYPHKFN